MIFTTTLLKKYFDANLLFPDTDSLTNEIKSKDIHDKFFKRKHLFDFNEFQSNLFCPTNKIVIGKMKDEFKGIPIDKFTGLKSKMYCISSASDEKLADQKE